MLRAFEILGYGPAAHGFVTYCQSKGNTMWEEGIAIKFPGSSTILSKRNSASKSGKAKVNDTDRPSPFGRKEFDQLLGEYEIASDIPSIVFAQELIDAYPEAKVIIVERDIETWFASFQIAWPAFVMRPLKRVICWVDPEMRALLSMNDAVTKGWFKATNQRELEANERDVYRDHYALIRKVTPPERLLDFKLKDGWGPLCEFLGKDIPEGNFPRVNDKGEYEKKAQIMTYLLFERIWNRFLNKLKFF